MSDSDVCRSQIEREMKKRQLVEQERDTLVSYVVSADQITVVN